MKDSRSGFEMHEFFISKDIAGKTGELGVLKGIKEEKAAEVDVDNMYYNLIESNYGKPCNLKVKN